MAASISMGSAPPPVEAAGDDPRAEVGADVAAPPPGVDPAPPAEPVCAVVVGVAVREDAVAPVPVAEAEASLEALLLELPLVEDVDALSSAVLVVELLAAISGFLSSLGVFVVPDVVAFPPAVPLVPAGDPPTVALDVAPLSVSVFSPPDAATVAVPEAFALVPDALALLSVLTSDFTLLPDDPLAVVLLEAELSPLPLLPGSDFMDEIGGLASGITASIRLRLSIGLTGTPSSPTDHSTSVYNKPFCNIVSSAAGGTRAPLMLLCDIWDSMPKTKAECENPDSCKYR